MRKPAEASASKTRQVFFPFSDTIKNVYAIKTFEKCGSRKQNPVAIATDIIKHFPMGFKAESKLALLAFGGLGPFLIMNFFLKLYKKL
jgi:hypothetical protein